MNQIDVGMHYL